MLSKIYIDNALVRAKSHLMKGEAFEASLVPSKYVKQTYKSLTFRDTLNAWGNVQ